MYHSALATLSKLPEPDFEPVHRVGYQNGSCAFQLDINSVNELPHEFNHCDLIYAELPYLAGYNIFMSRAGVEDYPAYSDFLNKIHQLIEKQKVRAVFTGPKTMGKIFDDYHSIQINQNGGLVYLYYKGVILPKTLATNIQVIEFLLSLTYCIGDIACGYGLTAKMASEAGKLFVATDVNARAIGGLVQNVRI